MTDNRTSVKIFCFLHLSNCQAFMRAVGQNRTVLRPSIGSFVYLQRNLILTVMAKYSRELDEALEKKVKELASAAGLREQGITIEPIALRSKKSYGEVIKANELVTLFTDDANMVCVAINEELFRLLDDQSQTVLIESLLAQIWYDDEKEKIVIIKPELNVGLGMYHKYKEIAVQKLELAYYTLQQIEDKKKEEKEAKKAERAEKKRAKGQA